MELEYDNPEAKGPQNKEQVRKMLISSLNKLAKTSPSNHDLQSAHKHIGLTMKHESFIGVIIELILEHQETPNSKNFLTQISTTFTTFLRHQQSRSPLVKRIDPNELNTQLIQIYVHPKISLTTKEGMMKHYPQFIYAPGMEVIRGQTVEKLCNSVGLQCKDMMEQINDVDFFQSQKVQYYLLLMPITQAIAKGPIESVTMKSIISQFLKPGLCIACRYVDLLQQSIDQSNQKSFTDIIYSSTKLVQFIKELVIQACKNSHMHYLQSVIFKEALIGKLIKSAFSLSLKPKEGRIVKQMMINQPTASPILNNLNTIKKYCMEMLIIFAKELIDTLRRNKNEKKEPLPDDFLMIMGLIEFMLSHMVHPFIEELSSIGYDKDKIPHPELCKIFIKALSYIVRISPFYSQNLELRNTLLYNLCLPLLVPQDIKTVTSAQDFIYKREDMLNTQSMDHIQNAVGKLVESYIDKIDGTVHQLSNYMVDMIKFQLSANPNNYAFMSEDLTSSYFFLKVDYLVQIQCAITVLALISYTAPGRTEIIALIEQFFEEKGDFLFRQSNSGTLKSAILLCYTYYVDDFYGIIKNRGGTKRQLHWRILEECCVMIKAYTQTQEINVVSKEERIQTEIAALQAIDCLNNCLTQTNLIAALFRVDQQYSQTVNEQIFLNFFRFFVFQLNYSLNIGVIEILNEFLLESIKKCYEKGYEKTRFNYKCDKIPRIIRNQLCQFLSCELIRLYQKDSIPNHILMKAKIMNVMQLVLTCCENPDKIMGQEFFKIKVPENHEWDTSHSIDIYLRRVSVMRSENKNVSLQNLSRISQYCLGQVEIAVKQGEFKDLLGIFVNLIMVQPSSVDRLIEPLAAIFLRLVKEDLDAPRYDEKLDSLLKELAYVLMIAIKFNLSEKNKPIWGQFVTALQDHYSQTSKQGYILFSSSNPFVGKTLTLSMIFIFDLRHNISDVQRLSFMFQNVLSDFYVYKSQSQKLITSITLINLLNEKEQIGQNDRQCGHSFNMVCNLIHSCFSSSMNVEKDDDGEDDFLDSDSDREEGNENKLNYKEYSINCNEFTEKEDKEAYLVALKNLCHKLKEKSPEFLKKSVEGLSFPVKNFIKQKVYFFEGNIKQNGLRKIYKVKQ